VSDSKNYLLKHVIGGKIEGTERRGRRCKQLPNDLKEKRIYWNLREGAAERILRRTGFGTGYGPVAGQDYITNELGPQNSTYFWSFGCGTSENVCDVK
jgi:hypothetical protein